MTTIDSLREFLESQFQEWGRQDAEPKLAQKGAVIAISRAPGCHGEQIAQTLAHTLGLALYDSKLVEAIAQSAHVSARVVASLDEKVRSELDNWLSGFPTGSFSTDQYLQCLRSCLFAIAAHGNAVIVGRGANFVLPAEKITLGICLVAPLEWRVQNVMQDLQISAEDARKQIVQLEQERRQWVKQIGFADIDDASNYHLVINTARVSTETLVQLVKASLAAVASGGLLPGAAPVSRPI